ncbi:MAG: cytochrome ubiquinol oxidase subunit I [Alphaproteobacteria bacterium]
MGDGFDPVFLSRIQWAWTISFHILFPAFTIGLASYLFVLEALWLRTKKDAFLNLYKFWVKIFAVSFGMGVVSGIVMSYQFGTNWSVFSDMTGPVLGPLIGYEVVTAFFLEAGFLGIMLFGWNRVGNKLHFLATGLVALGTLLSAFWILSANSWMHTPAGFERVGEQFHPVNWLSIVFNPSFPYRFVHMVFAAYLTTAFVVGSVAAWHMLKGRGTQPVRIMFSMAMWMATLLAPLQLLAGDMHGLNTLEHQPAKVAAMEGNWETRAGQPLHILALVDEEKEKTVPILSIPKAGSLILKHDPNAVVEGLKAFPQDERPPVEIVFWSFRIMVGIGMLMIAVGLGALVLRFTGKLYENRWFHRLVMVMGPAGFIAVLAGWTTTEVGRQPWVVNGILRTADAASTLPAGSVFTSLAVFVVVYCFIFTLGAYYLIRLMRAGPEGVGPQGEGTARRPKRPFSAVDEAVEQSPAE